MCSARTLARLFTRVAKFYREVCPHAKPAHNLVRCDAHTMSLLYPKEWGSYSCDSCETAAEELNFPPMWHCAEGCDYDICDHCARALGWQVAS